jgi:hypothetical protein
MNLDLLEILILVLALECPSVCMHDMHLRNPQVRACGNLEVPTAEHHRKGPSNARHHRVQ